MLMCKHGCFSVFFFVFALILDFNIFLLALPKGKENIQRKTKLKVNFGTITRTGKVMWMCVGSLWLMQFKDMGLCVDELGGIVMETRLVTEAREEGIK